MFLLPLKPRLQEYLRLHQLEERFAKQSRLFMQNPLHPSLETEVLEPKHLRIYCFRITQKYRAIFIYCGSDTIEIVDINNHYR